MSNFKIQLRALCPLPPSDANGQIVFPIKQVYNVLTSILTKLIGAIYVS